jgi:RimJ/RimL family protein N-acetyltransferase
VSLVTLRRSTVADAELIHAWRSEPSASRYQPILPLSLDQIRERLAAREAEGGASREQWTVETAEGPVGWVSLNFNPDDRRQRKGAIGYTISERFRGRGYATAAVGALVTIAFAPNRFALERLEAVAAVDNRASRRVLEATGFRLEGVLRGLLIISGVRVDHAAYGLLRIDWENRGL